MDGTNSVVAPLLFSAALLVIGLLNFFVFTVMDKTLDRQELNDQMVNDQMVNDADEFHVSDLKQIFTSKMFWIVALLERCYGIILFLRELSQFLGGEPSLVTASELYLVAVLLSLHAAHDRAELR